MNSLACFKLVCAAALLATGQHSMAHNGVEDQARHGGVVVASGPIHFEVTASAKGLIAIYFSDAGGRPLPASAVSQVAVEIEHPKGPTEYVKMAIGRTGASWVGRAGPMTDGNAVLHVGYVSQGKSALEDVSGSALMAAAKGAGHHGH